MRRETSQWTDGAFEKLTQPWYGLHLLNRKVTSGRNVEKQLNKSLLPAVREADDNNEIGAMQVRRK